MIKFKFLCALYLLLVSACTSSGESLNKGILKYTSGSTKIGAAKDANVIHLIRAIGVPDSNIMVGGYKYYQWDYSRAIGISTILGGGSSGFYCKLSAETRNDKVKSLKWYGNRCTILLDQINEHFVDKLNMKIITEDDTEQKVEYNHQAEDVVIDVPEKAIVSK